ncbi:hypothetical protein C0989_006179 [Termitomyces sp. Mn162]|nr:hypothetical protein C0989_006179 [Termitomyces sp. Mn162]
MLPAARYPHGCGQCQTALCHAAVVLEMPEAQALCTALSPGPEVEQEEFLLQLLAVKDATGAPSPEKPTLELILKEISICVLLPELEKNF